MKIYIATKLANADAAAALGQTLMASGHTITYPWYVHGSMQAHPDMWTEVAQKELAGVRTADLVVVLLPGGRGTHVELGAAIALGTPVLLIGRKAAFEEGGYTCAFYHLPNVRHEVLQVADLEIVAALALKHAGGSLVGSKVAG